MKYILFFILIFLTSSAYSQQYAVESLKLTLDELVEGKARRTDTFRCILETTSNGGLISAEDATTRNECIESGITWVEGVNVHSNSSYSYYSFDKNLTNVNCRYHANTDNGFQVICDQQKRFIAKSLPQNSPSYSVIDARYVYIKGIPDGVTTAYECPPSEGSPATAGPIKADFDLPTNLPSWCYNPLDVGDNHCPAPSENDIANQFGGDGLNYYCYNNPDGTQCKINFDESGMFTLPAKYATQEPSPCVNSEPDPDPNPDPDPTDDPDPLGDGTNTDNSDKTLDIDALNQANDNLDVINNNLREGNSAIVDRLDQLVDETQNTNQLLADVKDNTYDSASKQNANNQLISETNGLLKEISDKIGGEDTCENPDGCDSLSATAERKTSALDDLFNSDKLAALEADRDTLKQDLKDYYSQIKTEIDGMFDLQINATGTYEARTMNIKGVEIDYGLGRFASFWQALAPMVLFIFSCLSLYAVLGGLRD